MKAAQLELMENTPVASAILRLALPSMLAMLVQVIYGLTDTFFIGQTGNANMVASIALAMPFAMLIQAFGNIFAIGGASYISRQLGAKNYDEAKRTTATVFYLSILSGVIITIVVFFLMKPVLTILGTSPATRDYTQSYLSILTMFSFVQILQVVLAGLIRSEGATRQAMNGIFIGTGLNIVLDYLFILRWGWGVEGAAWATLAGNACGVLYYLFYFVGKRSLLTLSIHYWGPDKRMMFEVLAIGLPAALNALVMSVSHVLTNNIAVQYGDETIAANGIMMRIVGIVLFLIMGISQGYQPFAGYNYGAGNFERLKKAFHVTLGYASGLALIFCGLFYLYRNQLFLWFLPNQEVAHIGSQMLSAFLIAIPLFGLHFTIAMTFQATGKALLAFLIVLARQCLLFIPFLFLFNAWWGFEGYIWAQPIADVATVILSVCFFIYFLHHLPNSHTAAESFRPS